MIANISPDPSFLAESISTLRFAARAKCVQTHARVNLDVQGDVSSLRAEIAKLRSELNALKNDGTAGIDGVSDKDQLTPSLYQLRHLLKECLLQKHDTLRSELAVRDVLDKQSVLLEQKEKALQSKEMVLKFRDSLIDRMKENADLQIILQEHKVFLFILMISEKKANFIKKGVVSARDQRVETTIGSESGRLRVRFAKRPTES